MINQVQTWNAIAPTPGLFRNVDPDLYHSSRGISSSGLQTCLRKSPAHYRWQRDNPERKNYFDEGNAAHTLLLEPHTWTERVHIVDAKDWRTDKAKAERDAVHALHPTKYVLTAPKVQEVQAYARAVREATKRFGLQPDPLELIRAGEIEVSFVGRDAVTGMTLRARPDVLIREQRLIIDFKTDHDASPRGFARKAHDLGYGMRAVAYREIIAAHFHEDPNDWAFLWIVVEKEPPYAVGMFSATPDLMRHGAIEYRRALDLVATCEQTGVWPAYSNAIEPLDLPDWVKRDLPRISA